MLDQPSPELRLQHGVNTGLCVFWRKAEPELRASGCVCENLCAQDAAAWPQGVMTSEWSRITEQLMPPFHCLCVWWEGGGATLLTPSVIYSFFITHILSPLSPSLFALAVMFSENTHTHVCIRVWGSVDRSRSVCTLSLPRAVSTKNGKGADGRHSEKEPITGLCVSVCVSEQTVLASNSAGLR